MFQASVEGIKAQLHDSEPESDSDGAAAARLRFVSVVTCRRFTTCLIFGVPCERIGDCGPGVKSFRGLCDVARAGCRLLSQPTSRIRVRV